MADMFLWAMISAIIDSLLGFVGVFSLWLSPQNLNKIANILMAFAAGSLLGAAFFHLLPESLEKISAEQAFLLTLAGFILFIFLESYFHWHRCKCGVQPFSFVILVGDGVHNFLGGMVLAASFFVSTSLGIATIIAIIAHEFPQELGIFGVLVKGGFSRNKALALSFLAQSTVIIGAFVGCYLSDIIGGFTALLIPFAAGNFIYIASSDLVPEIHKSKGNELLTRLAIFLLGVTLMWIIRAH